MTWTALLSLGIWLFLVLAWGRFWRADQRLGEPGEREAWPAVTAVIPARNEAPTIGRTVGSLLAQDYPGPLRILVVDDNSDDGTAEAAGSDPRLAVVSGKPLPGGWAGKMWAVFQGVAAAGGEPEYLLLTDADIEHDPASLRRLVAKAEDEGRDLVSLMVLLRCDSFWERFLIPAFVFFFQKLYPFPWVNDPNKPIHAAAGGCMLVRRTALERAGGIESIRDRIIDDCALAAKIGADGPIWLGLTEQVRSLRPYDGLGEIWRMVARSAYEQLHRSVLLLVGTLAGMLLVYAVPPAAVAWGAVVQDWRVLGTGLGAWALMVLAFAPTLRLYGLSWLRGVALPAAAVLYTVMTVDSARRHWQGRGGAWKGRTY